MKYIIIVLLCPILNFAEDINPENPYFYDAKSYAQNRVDKFQFLKTNHTEMYPEIELNKNYIYDPIYHYGYIIGSQSSYRDMVNVLD